MDKFNMILFLFLLSGEGDTLKGKKGGKLCSLKVAHILSRLCQASHKRDTNKQYKPWSDPAERDIWSGLYSLY